MQFERFGYYVLDKESTPQHQVWNRTLPLREAAAIKTVTDSSRKAQQEQQLQDKMAKMKLHPKEMFQSQEHKALYSAFDENGIPTHDAAGEPVSKSLGKKLKKEWQKQAKLYEKHAAATATN